MGNFFKIPWDFFWFLMFSLDKTPSAPQKRNLHFLLCLIKRSMSLIFQSMVQHEWHQWILARATQIKPLNIVQSIEWREHWPLQKPFIAENLFSFTERQACHFKRWIPFIWSCAVVVAQAAGLTVISLPKVTLFILIVFVRPLVGRRDTSSSPGLSTTRSVSSISRDFRWSRPLKFSNQNLENLLSAHCSKSSFFVQKFNFDFPWK